MKTKQSGFAIVGVAIAMVAILAGSAYVFRNAGTSDDLVAQVSKAVKGQKNGTYGYRIETTPGGCPRVCDDILTKEYAAYRDYYQIKGLADSYCSQNLPICKEYTDRARQYATRAAALTKQYLACVKKYNAYKVCQPAHPLPTIPTYNCAKLKADAERLKKKKDDFSNGLRMCLEREMAKPGSITNGSTAMDICRKIYPVSIDQANHDNFIAAVDRYNNSCGGNMSKGY